MLDLRRDPWVTPLELGMSVQFHLPRPRVEGPTRSPADQAAGPAAILSRPLPFLRIEIQTFDTTKISEATHDTKGWVAGISGSPGVVAESTTQVSGQAVRRE
jgi:hypothetical protein